MRFSDRTHAGMLLSVALDPYRGRKDTVVLGIPRGGVAIAAEVAWQLGLPLHVIVIRKIGHPANPEVAVGAVSEFGTVRLEPVSTLRIAPDHLRRIVIQEAGEARRRRAAYEPQGLPDLAGKTVLLVDDGMATGLTMQLAVQEIKQRGANSVVIAVPVAPHDVAEHFRAQNDPFVCLFSPEYFSGVAEFYDEFPQLTDEHVATILSVGKRT